MSEGVRDCKKFGNHCSTPSLSFLSLLLFPCLSLLLPSSLPPSLYHSFSLCSSRLPPVFLSVHLFFNRSFFFLSCSSSPHLSQFIPWPPFSFISAFISSLLFLLFIFLYCPCPFALILRHNQSGLSDLHPPLSLVPFIFPFPLYLSFLFCFDLSSAPSSLALSFRPGICPIRNWDSSVSALSLLELFYAFSFQQYTQTHAHTHKYTHMSHTHTHSHPHVAHTIHIYTHTHIYINIITFTWIALPHPIIIQHDKTLTAMTCWLQWETFTPESLVVFCLAEWPAITFSDHSTKSFRWVLPLRASEAPVQP